MKVGVTLADVLTGLYAGIGVLAALAHRDRTGEGQHVDMSLLDVQVASLANQAMNYLAEGTVPGRLGNAHPNIVPYQAFATADGHLVLAIGNDSQFTRFCTLAGFPDLAKDDRYRTNTGRVRERERLIPMLEEIIAAKSTAWRIVELEKAGIPGGPINGIDEVFDDPQVRHRGMEIDFAREDGTHVPGVACPIRLSKTPPEYDAPPPRLGEHTDEVLAELAGAGAQEITELRQKGII